MELKSYSFVNGRYHLSFRCWCYQDEIGPLTCQALKRTFNLLKNAWITEGRMYDCIIWSVMFQSTFSLWLLCGIGTAIIAWNCCCNLNRAFVKSNRRCSVSLWDQKCVIHVEWTIRYLKSVVWLTVCSEVRRWGVLYIFWMK